MITEIKIILEEGSSNKAKGNCFEGLIRNLLSILQYEARGNINFSGMEIDLVAEHKHTKETLYVECKAKEKVTSDELSKFSFNVDFKEVDKGYFFRTQELEFQAGALLSEMRQKERYKHLKFFEPSQIVNMLNDAKMTFEPNSETAEYIISKKILAITYFGDFFIYLVNESNALPTKFILIDAKDNSRRVTEEYGEILKKHIPELSSLKLILNPASYKKPPDNEKSSINLEAISEVQESENWYDYLPASAGKKHFVGRDEIRTNMLAYFKQIRESQSNKRVFYLNGKSGWGKSSLVLELKNRCQNQHYRSKFFALAIDTRSAISDNFVALSFKKLLTAAIDAQFINRGLWGEKIVFTSSNDLLSSQSVTAILSELKLAQKYLVLIFDQFEDVFRKKDYFKTFYKFLTDVTDSKPNLIIGFSWKSDFLIQSDDPSYHIWQQAKEQAREFTVNEFGEKEIDGIIKQLEGSIGELGKGIKDRVKESSQGLPWLTKKLCIHIHDQINSGLTKKEDLIESNLNIVELFKKDEERISSKEFKAIKLIAKRAYDGNFFDESEVGDVIEGDTIDSLLHKRLIIRSGANYNIYWDIYRDYLVTGAIPTIGESYLLRQGFNICLEVFLLFDSAKEENLESLVLKHPKGISSETLYNILTELRNLGIIQKTGEQYVINRDIDQSRQGFIDFITAKFQNYTPYINIKKLPLSKISKTDIVEVLKNIFKQEFQDNTWDVYANILISWFLSSDLELKEKLIEPTKGRGGSRITILKGERSEMILRSSIREILEQLPLLAESPSLVDRRYNRDILLLDLIDEQFALTDFGRGLIASDISNQTLLVRKKALELPKMMKISELVNDTSGMTSKQLIKLLPEDFFGGEKESSKVIYATKAMTWAKFTQQ